MYCEKTALLCSMSRTQGRFKTLNICLDSVFVNNFSLSSQTKPSRVIQYHEPERQLSCKLLFCYLQAVGLMAHIYTVLRTAYPLATKLSLIVHCPELECLAKGLDCCGQGHSDGLKLSLYVCQSNFCTSTIHIFETKLGVLMCW